MQTVKRFFASTRTRIVAGAVGLLVLGGILGALAVTAIPALAANHGDDAANTTLTGNTTNPSAAGYCALYEQTLASKLGVNVSTLESDNIAAIDAVINQAVKDGKLSQTRATQIEQKVAANGTNVCSHIGVFLGKHHAGRFGAFSAALHQVRTDVQTAVAKKLGYADAAHLQSALAGTNIVSLAKSKGIDQATLNATIKSTVQADLNTLVSKGTITSAQETKALTMLTNLLNAGRYGLFGLGSGQPGVSL
jgi:uncharacterized protein YidB (DUF937 family)